MTLYVVSFIAPEPDDATQLASPELVPMAFTFKSPHSATRFRDHLRDLYEITATVEMQSPYTYDTAIQAVVEVIGPSPDAT